MANTAQPQWYKLRGVEYSTNFNFFVKHQLTSSKSTAGVRIFFSRLEVFTFQSIAVVSSDAKVIEKQINETSKTIHADLLAGKYGEGELVN